MSKHPETREIIGFVQAQRAFSKSERQWKKRLAQFGFAITDTENGRAILAMPKGRTVCILPDAA